MLMPNEGAGLMAEEHGTVLVTGASQGIGRSISTTLAAAGWRVVAVSRNQAALEATAAMIADAGGRAEVRAVDVTDEAAIGELADDLAENGLTPQALVNNSGIGGPSQPLWEVTTQEWDETFAVNVKGVYLVTRAFLPAMIERRGGAIVNIGSAAGKNPLPHRSAYAASKAAISGLTKALAADAGPHGVRVNLISPGAVSGDRLDWVINARARATGQAPEQVHTGLIAQSALHRLVEPKEIAEVVAFLLSDEASAITGIDVTVAAGLFMN
jgi:NAD(P)-dependent dehydrogenase (short-subunit alcohol dehydrogenase family)